MQATKEMFTKNQHGASKPGHAQIFIGRLGDAVRQDPHKVGSIVGFRIVYLIFFIIVIS